MADAFRFGAMALFEANAALCRGDPHRGRDRQYTVLDVPLVLADAPLRPSVLREVRDPTITY
jgi:hypothetical protein